MNVTQRILSRASLPPVPSSPDSRHLVLWHPIEKAFLLAALAYRQLWRVASDGSGELVATECFPEGFEPRYLHGALFYFDSAREAPVLLASTYATGAEHGLLLGAWDGTRFAPIAARNGIRTASSDAFVFDPGRGVLVHFVGQRDMDVAVDTERKARGGLTVRELGIDGVWKDVGAPLPGAGTYELYAGYEPRRKLVVVVDNDTNTTWGWDGKTFRELGTFPTWPWQPYTMAYTPDSGALLYLHRQRSSDDYKALLWELADEGWQAREAGTLETFGGAVHDPVAKETRIYAPWYGPGTVQHVWGKYEAGRVVPTGHALPTLTGGSTAGPVVFWGARPPGHGNYNILIRRPYSALVPWSLEGGELVALPPSPPALTLASSPRGRFAVGFSGELWCDEDQGWKEVASTPEGFTSRRDANVGVDAAGRILLVGGEPNSGRRLTDVWLFDGAWTRLAPKGGAPVASGACVARDEKRQAWIVAGGTVKYMSNPKLHELDDKKWTAFPVTLPSGEASLSIALLAWDAASSQVFAVASNRYATPQLCVYRGQGAFEPIAELAEAEGTLAFDAKRRLIVAAAPGSLAELDVGEALDAARREGAAAASGEPRPRKAAVAPAVEVEDEVWLKLEDGASASFWFARVGGNEVVVRSGKRGKAATTKTTAHDSPEKARKAHAKAVAAKLAAGYEHAVEKEAFATIPGRKAYEMKLGAKGDDLFGGSPPGISKERWPLCEECHCAMTHVATLHAHPERLPLTQHAALAIFVCGNEETAGVCETWDADEGANAVVFLSREDLAQPPLRKAPKGPEGEAPSPACRSRKIAYRERFEEDPEANENPEEVEQISKVGGYPGWIQFANVPECSVCAKEMVFVAQIGELDENLNFAGGDSYVFRCPEEHEARFLWQH